MAARLRAAARVDRMALLARGRRAVRAAARDAPAGPAAARSLALPRRAGLRAVLPEFPVLLLRGAGRAERARRGDLLDRAAAELDQRPAVHGPPAAAVGGCRRAARPDRHRVPVLAADGRPSRRSRNLDRARDRVRGHDVLLGRQPAVEPDAVDGAAPARDQWLGDADRRGDPDRRQRGGRDVVHARHEPALSRRARLPRRAGLGDRLHRVPDPRRPDRAGARRVLHGAVPDRRAGRVDGIRGLPVVAARGDRAAARGGRQSRRVRPDAPAVSPDGVTTAGRVTRCMARPGVRLTWLTWFRFEARLEPPVG
ncbi:hypothetical protein EMIT0111MI5_60143 [Burkholderia sp. IT-111MI5]